MLDILRRLLNSFDDITKKASEPDDQMRWIQSMEKETKFCNRFLRICSPLFPFYFEKSGTHNKVIGFYDPFRRHPNIKCPPRVYLWYLMTIYFFVKFGISTSLHLRIEYLVDLWKTHIRIKPPIWGSCVLFDNIDSKKADIRILIGHVNSWITYIEGLSTIDNEGLIFSYCCGWIATVLYLTFFIAPNIGFEYQMESLSFLCNPLNEKNRTKMSIRDKIEELSRALLRRNTASLNQISLRSHKNVKTHKCCDCTMAIDVHKVRIFNIISGKGFLDLIQPQNLEYGIYKIITKLFRISIFSNVLIFVINTLCIFYIVVSDEVHRRTEINLEMSRCIQWLPNATTINNPEILGIEPLVSELEYKSHTNETYAILSNPTGWDEILTIKFGFSIMELALFGSMLALWSGFFLTIFIIGFIRRLAWAEDINNQLALCLDLVDKTGPTSYLMKPKNSSSIFPNNIARDLLVAYLNFIMFRHDYKSYQRSSNRITVLMGINCSIIWISSFIVYSFVSKSNANIIWALALGTYILFNCIMATSIIIVSDVQRIFVRINQLVGKSSLVAKELLPVIDLMRNQLVGHNEITRIHCTKILGVHLDRSTFLTFNSYMIGAILYLLKSSSTG